MDIKLKRIDESVEPPRYAKGGDAGADLRSAEDVTIAPGHRAFVRCGFALEIPEGFCGIVVPRSGLAANHGITVLNSPGLIDSGYRGEICVVLLNTDQRVPFEISKGDRIAQLVILEAKPVDFTEAESLNESSRGTSGFGSSGIS